MLFSFLTYLQPTHYFQCFSKSGKSIFPLADQLPEQLLDQLPIDKRYDSDRAKDYDIAWRAIQMGYVGDVKTYTEFEELSVKDNYLFLRKNFHAAWVFYVLCLRILQLKNPIKEISGWWRTRRVAQIKTIRSITDGTAWESFESPLIKEAPFVSVVIPTLNRYEYLEQILGDFEQQEYKNFEVIVVDQSDNFDPAFYDKFDLNINLLRQSEKALWLARNSAIETAKGSIIALSEDDVRIQPDWIDMHLKCLDFFNAEVSAGVFYPEGQQIPKSRAFFARATQFATGNSVLYRSVFNRVGLFDRQFEKQRMGDGEFGMRLYLNGIKSVSNPFGSCIDIKAGTGGLREMGSWDAFRPSKFFAPRPIPSVLYYFRRYFGNYRARLAMLRTVPISVFPYQFKKNKPLLLMGVLVTFLIFPIVLYQVVRSWHLAGRKIKEGPIIPEL